LTIRRKLLLLLVATAALPVLVTGVLAYRGAEAALDAAVKEQHLRTARAEAEHAGNALHALAAELGSALLYEDPSALGPAQVQEFLARVYLRRDRIAQVALLDRQGRVSATVFVDDPEAFARQEPQFQRHDTVAPGEVEDFQRRAAELSARGAEGRAWAVSPPYVTRTRGRPAVVVVAFAREGGQVLAAELGLEELSQRMAEAGRSTDRVFLLDAEGRLLVDGNVENERRREDHTGRLPQARGATQGGLALYEERGQAWLAAYSPVPELGWVAVVARPREVALAPLRALEHATWAVLALALAAVGLLAPLLAQAVARPIRSLAEGARAVARGQLGHRIASQRKDELGDLARAFDDMGHSLEQAHQELMRFNGQLQSQVEERTRELREAQEQLLRSQRLAAVGDLAAGMAHEMNNPLAAIVGNVQLLLLDLPEQDPSRKALQVVQQQAQRIATIVRDLRMLAERQQLGKLPVDVHRLMKHALEGQDAELKAAAIQVECRFQPGEVRVLGDGQALIDVFGRLLGNAVNALRERPERQLTLTTHVLEAHAVRVELRDTGRGIPREHLGRIFNPFFTTKQQWTGKGLSLALCHRVIEDHGGSITIHSDEGVGTTVTLLLPAAPAPGPHA
jgi:signal transduction histidine kinase